MRSSGGTKFELAWSVVVRTNSMIACFAGPSFHDASWSPLSCANADPSSGRIGIAARDTRRTRRFGLTIEPTGPGRIRFDRVHMRSPRASPYLHLSEKEGRAVRSEI